MEEKLLKFAKKILPPILAGFKICLAYIGLLPFFYSFELINSLFLSALSPVLSGVFIILGTYASFKITSFLFNSFEQKYASACNLVMQKIDDRLDNLKTPTSINPSEIVLNEVSFDGTTFPNNVSSQLSPSMNNNNIDGFILNDKEPSFENPQNKTQQPIHPVKNICSNGFFLNETPKRSTSPNFDRLPQL